VGPHEILAALDGAGEAYRARDTRLDRTVVIRVLPANWGGSAAARERFERDAKTIAALNHPNIRALHDIGRARPLRPGAGGGGAAGAAGDVDPALGTPGTGAAPGAAPAAGAGAAESSGVHEAPDSAARRAVETSAEEAAAGEEPEIDFLVLEHLEGETVSERLARAAGSGTGRRAAALRVDEALAIAMQIADALDKAHQKGVVHRDLRPESVFLVKGGKPSDPPVAKLLDLGWAPGSPADAGGERSGRGARLQPSENLTSLPTVAAPTVQAPAAELEHLEYKAPEQVEGRDADSRTDVFALGVLLYEMLTGRKAFEGKSRAVLMAAIMTAEPDPLLALQPQASPALDHVLKRCLAKDPDDRWQTSHDLLVQLRWVAGLGLRGARAAPVTGTQRAVRLGAAAAVVAAAALAPQAAFYFRPPEAAEPFQFRSPVVGLSASDISISPDGQLLAFVARPNTSAPAAVYIRPVASVDSRRLDGTDDASQPFWSPDSRYVGFVAGNRLKSVEAAGGAPREIGDAPGLTGAAWGRDGTILFGSVKGLMRVSAEGGKPEAITTLERGETGHFWPHFLPDGSYLFLAWAAEAGSRALYAATLDSKPRARVMPLESNVVFTDGGFLVFHREATVYAQPFDADRRAIAGEAVQLAGGVAYNPATGRGNFDASRRDALVYFQGDAGGGGTSGRGGTVGNMQFGWVSRTGQALGPAGAAGPYGDMDLSPDGRLVAVTRQEGSGTDIWVIDWQRAAVATRLTLDPADDLNPVFSPDSTRVAFTTWRKGNADIYVKNANGVGAETPILESASHESIEAWSRDGRYIAYLFGGPANSQDIYALLLADRKPFPVVRGPFQKDEPQFSYDGKWLAYTSNESGSFQVYVTSFPAADQRLQVTMAGGGQPRWRGDGRELYYRAPDNRIMAVEIRPGARIEAGEPRLVFNPVVRAANTTDPTRHMLAASPDGQRFLLRIPIVVTGGATGFAQANTTFAPGTGQSGGRGAIFTGTARGGRGFSAGQAGLTVIRNWTAAMAR
jgi:serine/threonine protein kinase/Tol biopolymer transport system component